MTRHKRFARFNQTPEESLSLGTGWAVGKSWADVKWRHWCLHNDLCFMLSHPTLPVSSFFSPSCQRDKLDPWTIFSIPQAALLSLLHKSQLPGDSWRDSTSGSQIELSEKASVSNYACWTKVPSTSKLNSYLLPVSHFIQPCGRTLEGESLCVRTGEAGITVPVVSWSGHWKAVYSPVKDE